MYFDTLIVAEVFITFYYNLQIKLKLKITKATCKKKKGGGVMQFSWNTMNSLDFFQHSEAIALGLEGRAVSKVYAEIPPDEDYTCSAVFLWVVPNLMMHTSATKYIQPVFH